MCSKNDASVTEGPKGMSAIKYIHVSLPNIKLKVAQNITLYFFDHIVIIFLKYLKIRRGEGEGG